MLEKVDLACIEHLCSDCKMNAMLIPIGLYKNQWVLRLKSKDIIQTIDDPPVEIMVYDKIVIPVKSGFTNAISMLIYGKPIEHVFQAMFNNYRHDIQRDEIILLIYERVDKSKTQIPKGNFGSLVRCIKQY